MCLGGGVEEPFNARKSGFDEWMNGFNAMKSEQTAAATAGGTVKDDTAYINPAFETYLSEDPSAAMEMRELRRQHGIGLGRIGIDKAYTKFDDPYYQNYEKTYKDFYTPELDRQYGDVVDKTTAALAGRGTLESSVGNNALADLSRENQTARTNIANEATDAGKKLRGQVENSKSSMYSMNEASANPQAVNAQAVGQASALVAPPTFSPLGNVFASALSSLGNFASAKSNSPTRRYQSPIPTGSGSSYQVA